MATVGLIQVFCLLLALLQVQGRCGVKPASSRIVGGSYSRANAWPWMVQITNTRFGANHHWCGGSLISPEWLVTATHCVNYGKQSDYKFTLGEHDRLLREGPEQVFRAKRIILRDDFSTTTINNDIALVQLDRPARLNSKVGTVCLPPQGYQVPVGSYCVNTGWGLTSGGGSQSRILKQAVMPIASTAACQKIHYYLRITDQMVCAGKGGRSIESSCQSDSGGPLVCPGRDGSWTLQGVVSWGDGQCRAGKYSVYARVSEFRNWIYSYTGKFYNQ